MVEVDGVRYTADHVVLANGADAVVPPVPGLRELEGVWGTNEATGMKAVPRRLLVLGGGPAGVELGQVVRRLGGEVALVEGADRVLAREPAALGEALGEALRRDGIELVLGVRAVAASRDGDDFVLRLEDGRELRGDRLLVATGRRPRVEGIGLETVGITPDPRGIPVDSHMRAGERLWAIGDVTGILAADPRRRVSGRGGRLEHPRRTARGPLRGGPARHLHRSAGRGRGRDRGRVQRHRAVVRASPRPRPTRTPTRSRTGS